MQFSIRFTLFLVVISIIISMLLLCFGIVSNQKIQSQEIGYLLKSYKNSVALYKGNELLEIYDDIVLNTLPQNDINRFNKGVEIKKIDEIDEILQDYDS